MPKTHEQILAYYREKLDQQTNTLKQCAQRWKRFSYLRGGLFLLSLVPLFLGLYGLGGITTGWFILAGLLFLAFLGAAYYHEGLQTDLKRATLLASMHRESLARCERRWSEIRVPKVEIPPPFVPLATDLDLFGETSLYKLLGTPRTTLGIETLRQWIMTGAPPNEVKRRQEAVAELQPEFDWRLDFRLECEQLASGQSGPNQFVQWAESPDWFAGRRWVLWLTRITAIGSLAAIAGLLLARIGLPIPWTLPALVLAITVTINFFLSVVLAGTFHEIFNQVSSRAGEALHYVRLFDRVATFPARSTKLKSLQQRLHDREHDAQKNVRKLGTLAALANMRRNGILFLFYLAFEFLFFWDVHCLDLLERWKKKNGPHVRGWFSDLGEWETLAALAKLAGDEPNWVFPTVQTARQPDAIVVDGQRLGHPLIDQSRVPNDVQVGPPGTVLLVTGSNMSGKSTLLRSIGVNIVLAQMGSVVCARQMRLPPIHIETSMRIADSLSDGVSFFMAELKRLKEIVDRAEQLHADGNKTMLFLLDEILQGTNSRERQIAVSRVVRKLIDEGAIGAISTHDLDLATTGELESACQPVHFSEQFHEIDGQQKMTFNYQMQPGIAETTNALKLLEMVGL